MESAAQERRIVSEDADALSSIVTAAAAIDPFVAQSTIIVYRVYK